MEENVDYRMVVISMRAQEIRKTLGEGMIYGRPIDMDDLDQVIVAAFYLGQMSRDLWREEGYQRLDKVFGESPSESEESMTEADAMRSFVHKRPEPDTAPPSERPDKVE